MDYYIGYITVFPYTFEPMYWLWCKGQTLPISQYSALFALIGTTYGGDGVNNFKIPNMQGLEAIPGLHYAICIEGVFPSRP